MSLAADTPDAARTPGHLAEALAPVQAAVRAFTDALGEERSALTDGAAEALAAAAACKQAAAERLADARQGLFAAAWRAGFAGDGDGVRRWAERIAPLAPELLERYRELGERLAECERDNRLHGRMIAARRHAVETGLDLLLGRSERSAATVYDAGGRRHRGAGGRMLDTA